MGVSHVFGRSYLRNNFELGSKILHVLFIQSDFSTPLWELYSDHYCIVGGVRRPQPFLYMRKRNVGRFTRQSLSGH